MLSAGTRIGPYEVVSSPSAGGMGVVYRARDPRLNRDVAIKLLPSIFSTDPDRLRRFEQEALASSALNHPNILTIYDVGRDGDAPSGGRTARGLRAGMRIFECRWGSAALARRRA